MSENVFKKWVLMFIVEKPRGKLLWRACLEDTC